MNGRSFLFVPGDRPDRFAKALASGADAVILDLEDAVAPEHKTRAREHVRAWLASGNRAIVRINAAGTPWHRDDVEATRHSASALMVPKAETPADLDLGVPTIPLIETAAGVLNAATLCKADTALRPAFGSIDLATQLGVDHHSHLALRHARSTVVLASAAAGRGGPIDGVTTALDSPDVLAADLDHALALGFTAKLCVHPRQVAAVNRAFVPSRAQLRWARAVIVASADGSAAAHDGQMVDLPLVSRARALLAAMTPAAELGMHDGPPDQAPA
ncbi:CoA ester lyase [Lentzea sp. HUAS12]|uniref:HpcH/HpaI aldolase/citrate lyase family protein n=1 Tax=Lentzea sp. HUAS12 TaxID=2951806 RepID=UPI00209D44B2|nr:CoA ester lyase [Lentzea sp. HUAS12]USX53946.1 CoA ester lyase [Lentzea sp. HUAS12]